MKSSTSIVFTGDISFDNRMEGKWEDDQLLSSHVLDFLHSADHVCANVEGALYDATQADYCDHSFRAMNPASARALKKIGADIWSIGNHQIMDAKLDGVLSTKNIATELDCCTFGAGLNLEDASRPLYLEEAGGIGMICVTCMNNFVSATDDKPSIFRWDDMDTIAKRINEIKSKCRWCIVVAHGGEEFAPMPLPYTRNRYIDYLEMGADVVVGHHPHVPENYELFDDGKAIFYSLGNFILDANDQRIHQYTDLGVLLRLNFTENEMDFEAIGIKLDRGWERVDVTRLPNIFTNIPVHEFELLTPLAAKAFVQEEKRKMTFLNPQRFSLFTQDDWDKYFATEISSSYYPGAHQNFHAIIPLAEKALEGRWRGSELEEVKQYILNQLML